MRSKKRITKRQHGRMVSGMNGDKLLLLSRINHIAKEQNRINKNQHFKNMQLDGSIASCNDMLNAIDKIEVIGKEVEQD